MRIGLHLSILLTYLFSVVSFSFGQSVTATINESNRTATMSNGIVSLTINSKGHVNSLLYNGKDLIDASKGGRFYFSYNDQDGYYELSPSAVRIQKINDDYAEVVYSNTNGKLIVEQAFIMMKGVSGLYSYVTVKGTATPVTLREMRVVYRVSPSLFSYGYVTDQMKGDLPSVEVMKEVDDQSIMDATYPLPDGTIYTKYNWANYVDSDSVHGILSESEGVWAIPVSSEYINGGPMRQELTVHATNKTPLVLQMLQGEHMGASAQVYREGDEKIYGPFFIYVNKGISHDEMIKDAKTQVAVQKAQWPFQWLENDLYPLDRSTVSGTFKLTENLSADSIRVVLAQPGSDVYSQGKDYIFWSLTEKDGDFSIKNIRAGNYTLYAYATTGEITDEFTMNGIEVFGSETTLGVIEWKPEKYEKLLWLLGENDRLSKGYRYSDTLRSYGLYDLPPANLEYVIGSSEPSEDWYYAQTKAGSWTIKFNNDKAYAGDAILTASIAGASNSPSVAVYVNGEKKGTWSFSNDASIYRSAVLSGRHAIKTLSFPASSFIKGENSVTLTMSNQGNRGGVMYDCIKLEAAGMAPEITGIADNGLPLSFRTYPNPFSEQIAIEINMPAQQNLSVAIYNLQGELVERLFDASCKIGKNSFTWTPGSQTSGIYYCRVTSEMKTMTGKLVLLK